MSKDVRSTLIEELEHRRSTLFRLINESPQDRNSPLVDKFRQINEELKRLVDLELAMIEDKFGMKLVDDDKTG